MYCLVYVLFYITFVPLLLLNGNELDFIERISYCTPAAS